MLPSQYRPFSTDKSLAPYVNAQKEKKVKGRNNEVLVIIKIPYPTKLTVTEPI